MAKCNQLTPLTFKGLMLSLLLLLLLLLMMVMVADGGGVLC